MSLNEFEALDHQLAALNNQITEIANLLESRLGATSEMAAQAKEAQRAIVALSRRIHRQNILTSSAAPSEGKTQTA